MIKIDPEERRLGLSIIEIKNAHFTGEEAVEVEDGGEEDVYEGEYENEDPPENNTEIGLLKAGTQLGKGQSPFPRIEIKS